MTRVAERQYGVVARRQLSAIGLTRSMIEERIAAGTLIRLHPGVYALGHRQLLPHGHRLAAVLACGPGAALSHRDAAALHGLRPSGRTRIDVTTPRRIRGDRPGIEIHHSATLDARDVTTVEGIPVTTVERTLVDLADVVPTDSLAKALREAEQLRVVDVNKLREAMERTRNRPGPGHARLAVELDGWQRHKDRQAFQRDRTKGNAITHAGWRLLRFTHDDVVRQPAETAAAIGALLAGA